MTSEIDNLYQELLLEHARHPKNFGGLGDAITHLTIRNPLCGDVVTVWLDLSENRVLKARFEGKGCLLSKASSSVLMSEIEGLSIEKVEEILQSFERYMRGESEAVSENFEIFEGVRRLPVRQRCVLLPYSAVRGCLQTA